MRQEDAAIAAQDRDLAHAAVGHQAFQRGELFQPRPFLVLHHLAGRMRRDDAGDHRRRHEHAGRIRIVLDHERHVVADRLHGVGVIGDDLVVGLERRRRRDHHAARAGIHHVLHQRAHRGEARRGRADHHRQAIDPPHHLTCQRDRFRMGQLRRLAHDAEHRDAGDAAADVEIHQPVEARAVDRAVLGERRRRDDVDAACVNIEHLPLSLPSCSACRLSAHCYRLKRDHSTAGSVSRGI